MKQVLLSDIKDQINTGDLVAFSHREYGSITSFILWLYQKVAKVDYSHVGVVIKLGERLFIVEAVPPRVNITPIEKVDDFYWIPTKIQTSERWQIDYLLKSVETPYSIVDMFTHYLGMKFRKDRVYCSELASAFYYHVGYILDRSAGHTPDKIVRATKEAGGVTEDVHVITDRGNLQ